MELAAFACGKILAETPILTSASHSDYHTSVCRHCCPRILHSQSPRASPEPFAPCWRLHYRLSPRYSYLCRCGSCSISSCQG
jgi:hypothetical protein